ncbi:MAG: flavin reductase family protein [Gammaproteobacteria bacterium]|nr:flavin reductase family protein [Gammaproteobacteria bacterium]
MVDETPLDSALFRQSVSLFTTGIVVVTCEDDGKVHGMTVNSFTSVSLAPPTVLISVKAGKTNRLITRNGRYGACILSETQLPYSAHFSGRPQESLRPEFVVRDRVPTLQSCLAWFECAVLEKVEVHDHSLFVAQVTACGNEDGTPLMFYASRYHRRAIDS